MSSSPAPLHLFRVHSFPVNAISFSPDNERLYSGDADGHVVVLSTRTFRPIVQWRAHNDSILTVEEWDHHVVTHARDNKLHVWTLTGQDPDAKVGDSATAPGLMVPVLCYSMDVNALNYCRFSLMPVVQSTEDQEARALIALPNLIESSLADIWELPAQDRLHAAIGKSSMPELMDGRGKNPIGIIMSMHLFEERLADQLEQPSLRLLCAYENGSVKLWERTDRLKLKSIEGNGWSLLWTSKLHAESVMSMAVSRSHHLALTVSADHLIGRYDLKEAKPDNLGRTCMTHRTKYPGNASIAIRDDGRVCAVGGWDGKVRLYSTKTLKPLGTLDSHKKSCQTVAFAHTLGVAQGAARDESDSEDEMTEAEKESRGRWLAVGSQDNRISLWPLISFERT